MRIAIPEPRVRPDLRFRKELEAQEFGDFRWLSPSLIGLEMEVGEGRSRWSGTTAQEGIEQGFLC